MNRGSASNHLRILAATRAALHAGGAAQWNQAFFGYFEATGGRITGVKTKGDNAVLLEPGLEQRSERGLEKIKEIAEPERLSDRGRISSLWCS